MEKTTWNLELMFIFFNCNSSTVIVDEKGHTDRDLIFKKKKHLMVNLLELILVKNIMLQIITLVEYKHLLVNLKIKKKEIRRKNKRDKSLINKILKLKPLKITQ